MTMMMMEEQESRRILHVQIRIRLSRTKNVLKDCFKYVSSIIVRLNINLEIAHTKKSDTNPAFYQAAHKEFVEHFPGYNFIYTDGSLSDSKAASAAVLGVEAFTLKTTR